MTPEEAQARRDRHQHDGWIGVDLDGTLAHYDRWRGPEHIGEPIIPMLERVNRWLAEGRDVRIFTARIDGGQASGDDRMRVVQYVKAHIEQWCMKHLGRVLPITNVKDFAMIELWDDRAIQVIPNTGISIADELAAERLARSGKP